MNIFLSSIIFVLFYFAHGAPILRQDGLRVIQWHLGSGSESCVDVCATLGAVCSEGDLAPEIQSDAWVRAAAEAAGQPCSGGAVKRCDMSESPVRFKNGGICSFCNDTNDDAWSPQALLRHPRCSLGLLESSSKPRLCPCLPIPSMEPTVAPTLSPTFSKEIVAKVENSSSFKLDPIILTICGLVLILIVGCLFYSFRKYSTKVAVSDTKHEVTSDFSALDIAPNAPTEADETNVIVFENIINTELDGPEGIIEDRFSKDASTDLGFEEFGLAESGSPSFELDALDLEEHDSYGLYVKSFEFDSPELKKRNSSGLYVAEEGQISGSRRRRPEVREDDLFLPVPDREGCSRTTTVEFETSFEILGDDTVFE